MKKLLLATCLVAIPSFVFAQNNQTPLEITISKEFGTPIKNSIIKSNTSSAVYKSEETDTSSYSVMDSFKTLPGVTVNNQGSVGQLTNFRIRNLPSSQAVLLVNGVRQDSPALGIVNLDTLDIWNVSDISRYTGSKSVIYGSGATGGVINVRTRTQDYDQGNFISQSIGNYGYHNTALGLSNKFDKVSHNTILSYTGNTGFDAVKHSDSAWYNEDDKDGFKKYNLNTSWMFNVSDDSYITQDLILTKGESEYDAYMANSDNRTDSKYINSATTFHKRLTNMVDSETKLQFFREDYDNKNSSTKEEFYSYKSDAVTLGQELRIYQPYFGGISTTIVGADYTTEDVDVKDNSFDKTSRNNIAGYFSHENVFNKWTYDINARLDHSSQFNDNFSWGVGSSYKFNDKNKVRANFYTAFHQPTFNDLYNSSAAAWGYLPNPDLEPETSKTWELGYEWTPLSNLQFSATGFYTKIDDMIANKEIASWTYKRTNLDKVTSKGIELAAVYKLGKLQFTDTVTLASTKDDKTDKYLIRASKYVNNLDIRYHFTDKSNLGMSIYSVGNSYNDTRNTQKLDNYHTVSVNGKYDINNKIELSGRIDNIFNDKTIKTYSNFPDQPYNVPGTQFIAGIKYKF